MYEGTTVVVGQPQRGKTLYAVRRFSAEPGAAVWITPNWRRDKLRGYEPAWNLDAVVDRLARGERRVVWFARLEDGQAIADFVDGTYEIRSRLAAEDRALPGLRLYLDEADRWQSTGPALQSPAVLAVSKMGNLEVACVVITQRLGMLPRNVYANAWEYVVYRLYSGDWETLRVDHRIEVTEEVRAWARRPYCYARYDVDGRWWLGDAAYAERPAATDEEDEEEDDDEPGPEEGAGAGEETGRAGGGDEDEAGAAPGVPPEA